jgi:hypothetical protein
MDVSSWRDTYLSTWTVSPLPYLHNWYSSNILRVTKSRRMIWAGHVTRMGEMLKAFGFIVGKILKGETIWETWA